MKGLEEIKEKLNNVNKYSVMIGRGNSFAKGLGMIDELLRDIEEYVNQVEQPALPVIPKFVAEWIEKNKDEFNLRGAFSALGNKKDYRYDKKVDGWLCYPDKNGRVIWNDETLAIAWIFGYTVEEKKYYVEDKKHTLLCKVQDKNGWEVISTLVSTEDGLPMEILDYGLTEQEIKGYDERYFAFAVPVEELEE